MSKNLPASREGSPHAARRLFRYLLCAALAVAATGTLAAQNVNPPRISLDVTASPLARVVESLRSQSGYEFVFNSVDVGSQPNVTITLIAIPLRDALDALLGGSDLEWTIENRTVIIRRRTVNAQQAPANARMTGTVRDASGEALPGVQVIVDGTTRGTVTGSDGNFAIESGAHGQVLEFSFLGMETQKVTWHGRHLDVVMHTSAAQIDAVVVRGMIEVREESQVGSSKTFSQDELRRAGNTNVIRSLANLDASFNIVENLLDGSNPNAMPEIRLRGQSGFPNLREDYQGNPNQPLFILDGFEASLTKVMDMDMSRVASVTILKDAAAKAIYGSRAANGVVVIETHRPEIGELRLSYTGTVTVQAPDLRSYNLTNAREKLDVEKDGEHYLSFSSNINDQYENDMIYNRNLENVLRGVDTYWLAKPLRTGIGNKHVLYLEGGTERFTYGIDFSYNNVAGVMKGSSRNTISGGMTVSYRYRNLTLRNSLDVVYNKGNESPYGTFSEYANMNPYYPDRDENGRIVKVLDENPVTGNPVTNPLWNSTIGTLDFTEYSQFTDNLTLEWRTDFGLKTDVRASISRTDNGNELFRPAGHTEFVNYDTDELRDRRGRYNYGDGMEFKFTAKANVSYTLYKNKHYFAANVGAELNESNTRSLNFQAEGFSDDYIRDITFARRYLLDGKPTGYETPSRSVGVYLAANYSYDEDRYLFEGSFRTSGSSRIGRNNPWSQYWSLGLGWNLHKEEFMSGAEFIDRLKIRASIGSEGAEDFGSFQARATYGLDTSLSYLGNYGAHLLGIENPDLGWQRTSSKNIGFDAQLFGDRLGIVFDLYEKDTNDLLTEVTIAPSTGFDYYTSNIGQTRNRGFDANISYRVWSDSERGNFARVWIGASRNTNKVLKISNTLTAYNDRQTAAVTNRPVIRFIEGESLNVIWAVPSRGIDPASGRDILVRQDGTVTFVYDPVDLAVCGDTEPKMSGNGGFSLDLSGFSLNVGMTWRFGGQIYNTTVVDRVENANLAYNVDRRVFSDRWREPGDVSWFKNIADRGITRSTSRFVEDLNEWAISSLNLSYELQRVLPVDRLGMSRLKLSFDMADVARVSSVKIERGTAYPFARTFSFSLQASF